MTSEDERFPFESNINIKFLTQKQAEMVKTSLEVDEELQPKRVKKLITVEENNLIM